METHLIAIDLKIEFCERGVQSIAVKAKPVFRYRELIPGFRDAFIDSAKERANELAIKRASG